MDDAGGPRVEVAVVGTLNLDHTVRVLRLPRPGESVVGETVASGPGGKGANQAVAAARQGVRTALLGCLGDDAAGTALLGTLGAEPGLDLGGVRRVEGTTGTAFVTIDGVGGNTVVSARGANARLDDEHVHRHGRAIADAAVVLVQLGIPRDAVRAALDVAHGVGTLVVLDPAPADDVTDDLLLGVDVCTPNETEAERLTGIAVDDEDGVERAARALVARGPGAVVVTLGARGAFLATAAGEQRHVGAPSVAVVDPTGAGDAFCGTLAAALARGAPIGDAVTRAVVAGALATTRLGAVASLPSLAEVDAARATPGSGGATPGSGGATPGSGGRPG